MTSLQAQRAEDRTGDPTGAPRRPAELRALAHDHLVEARRYEMEAQELFAEAARLESSQALEARLSPDDAAAFLRVKRGTLNAWRRNGRGPRYVMVGTKITYLRADLESWLQSRRIGSTAERRDLGAQ